MLLLQQQKNAISTMTGRIIAAGVAVITTAVITMSPAFALVSFSTDTGTGFVGKGDVQSAFGWNNADAQAEAGNLAFTYVDQASYDVTCEWEVYPGRSDVPMHFEITVSREQNINDTVVYDARTEQQVNGFNLVGYSSQTGSSTEVPQVGSICPVEPLGTVTAVELVSATPGGLYVSDPSLSLGPVLIWSAL